MSVKKKFITRVERTESYDSDSGEKKTLNVNVSSFLIDKEPEFIKLYIQDIGRLNSINGKANEVLLAFISKMGYNNIIPTYKPIKEMIAKDLNISLHTVEKAIKSFKKKGLFIPFARGMYIADPELFARGSWKDIKQLRVIIQYNQDGTKEIKSNLSEQVKQLRLDF